METVVRDTIEIHKRLVAQFETCSQGVVIAMADLIADCFNQGCCLYICGNGGSAADAQHIAGEFIGRFRKERRALPAVALTTDTSVLTCIGNDYIFKDVFVRQVEALVKPGYILWAFSTSGAQEIHLLAYHIICDLVEQKVCGTKFN